MRLFACLGSLLLVSGACAHIPDHVRVEVDGSTIEIIKKPTVAPSGDET